MTEQHRLLLAESSETLQKCVQEVRSVSYLLHPPLLDEMGLGAAIRWHLEGFHHRSGIEIRADLPTDWPRIQSRSKLDTVSSAAWRSEPVPWTSSKLRD